MRSFTAFLKSGWGRFALLLVFLLVLLGFWGLLRAPEAEGPLHDGRSLAQWFHVQRHPDFTESFDDDSINFLGGKLTDSSSQKRAAAVSLLGSVGRPPLEFMETLGSLVEDEDPRVSSHAIWTLQRYRRSSPSIVSSVVHHSRKGLDHEEAFVRRSAARALANFGSTAQEALPRLRELSELDPVGRNIILDAISKIDPELNGE